VTLKIAPNLGGNSGLSFRGGGMIQTKFTLEESQIDFLQLFKRYGFKDKSAVVRSALDRLANELALEELRQSAEIYADLYETDPDLQELTETALQGWPT
jgi:hypothetical protein